MALGKRLGRRVMGKLTAPLVGAENATISVVLWIWQDWKGRNESPPGL